MSAEAVDWPAMLRVALGVLRLSPDAFWTMTPAEFRAAVEGAGLTQPAPGGAMPRQALSDLMAAHPDRAAPLTEEPR